MTNSAKDTVRGRDRIVLVFLCRHQAITEETSTATVTGFTTLVSRKFTLGAFNLLERAFRSVVTRLGNTCIGIDTSNGVWVVSDRSSVTIIARFASTSGVCGVFTEAIEARFTVDTFIRIAGSLVRPILARDTVSRRCCSCLTVSTSWAARASNSVGRLWPRRTRNTVITCIADVLIVDLVLTHEGAVVTRVTSCASSRVVQTFARIVGS